MYNKLGIKYIEEDGHWVKFYVLNFIEMQANIDALYDIIAKHRSKNMASPVKYFLELRDSPRLRLHIQVQAGGVVTVRNASNRTHFSDFLMEDSQWLELFQAFGTEFISMEPISIIGQLRLRKLRALL